MKKKIIFYRTLWGVDLNFSNFSEIKSQLLNFKTQGFEGLEIATGFFDNKFKSDFLKLIKELDFKVVTQIHTMGYPITNTKISDHFDDFKKKVEDSLTWSPSVINSHTGRDDWSTEENLDLFRKISEYENTIKNIFSNISHETHRQRCLFNPRNSYEIMKNFPKIKYTADLSHWSVVNSRLCNESTDPNWNEIIKILLKNTLLIHARVSSTEQIQVADPFSEDNKENREYYENLWKKIYQNSEAEIIHIDPEYGPFPYAILNPSNQKYLVDVDQTVQKSVKHLKNILV
jgi:hypothetical protein